MTFSCILTKKADIQVGDCVHCEATLSSHTYVEICDYGGHCIGYIPKNTLDYDVAQYLRGRWPARIRSIDDENSLTIEFVGSIVQKIERK
jgi:hypothetical protein